MTRSLMRCWYEWRYIFSAKFQCPVPQSGLGHLWREGTITMTHYGFGGHLEASVSHGQWGEEGKSPLCMFDVPCTCAL